MQGPAYVPLCGLARFGSPVHAPPAPHDPLDVVGRAGAAHRQQTVLGLGCGDTGQGADLGVRELTARERLGQARERFQGAGDANALAGRPQVEPHAPAEPGGAGAKAGVPAPAGVELTDEIEEACGGGLEVRR